MSLNLAFSVDKCARYHLGLTPAGCHLVLIRGLCHLGLGWVFVFYLGLYDLEFLVV